MGNNESSGKSQSKKGSSKAPWIKLEDKEKQGITLYLKKFLNDNKEFRLEKFLSTIFTYISKEISSNINNFLNSYYAEVKSSRKIQPGQTLDGIDIMTLAQILIKSTMDSDENIYYHKKMILILYDMMHGEILRHKLRLSKIPLNTLANITIMKQDFIIYVQDITIRKQEDLQAMTTRREVYRTSLI